MTNYRKFRELADKDEELDVEFDRKGFRPLYTIDLFDKNGESIEAFSYTSVGFHNLDLAIEGAKLAVEDYSDENVSAEIYEEKETESGDIYGEPFCVWSSDVPVLESSARELVDKLLELDSKKEYPYNEDGMRLVYTFDVRDNEYDEPIDNYLSQAVFNDMDLAIKAAETYFAELGDKDETITVYEEFENEKGEIQTDLFAPYGDSEMVWCSDGYCA